MKILRYLLLIFLLPCNLLFAAESPKRIVSLAPSITRNIYFLGAQDSLVGVTIYCRAVNKDRVGTLTNPNIEKIISLKPDYVLISLEGNSENTIEALKKLGIKVVVFGPNKNFQSIVEDFLKLGELVGKGKEAAQLASEIEDEARIIRDKIRGQNKLKVFWQVGSQPLITIGKESFNNDMISMVGGENIFADLNLRYSRVNREEVAMRNPDVIIVADMGALARGEAKVWSKFTTINAVKNNRVYLLNADLVCQPTPQDFTEALKEIARLLHPQLFKKQ